MEIRGRVHCFFEQSGTFKREFQKLGIPAEDYDIQDNFGETDHVIDLFAEIEAGYEGRPSVFDGIGADDLIMAFFPCIYFENIQMLYFSLEHLNNAGKPLAARIDDALERLGKRTRFHALLYKLLRCVAGWGLRLVVENPFSPLGYLTGVQNFPPPAVVDMDRTRRGDWFVKPTAYWFFNCRPTRGFTRQQTPRAQVKTIARAKSSGISGLCSEERSMISPDYARNFICDFLLGREQPDIDRQGRLFPDFEEVANG